MVIVQIQYNLIRYVIKDNVYVMHVTYNQVQPSLSHSWFWNLAYG